jgi:hypothetical protein
MKKEAKNDSSFIKKLVKIIISKGKNHSLFKSVFYLFDITESDTFMLRDNNRHKFEFYSVIKSVKFENYIHVGIKFYFEFVI